jgi:hypothetical protein
MSRNTEITPKAVLYAVISDLTREAPGKRDVLLSWLRKPGNMKWAEGYAKTAITGKVPTKPSPAYQSMSRPDVALEGKSRKAFYAEVRRELSKIKDDFPHAPFPPGAGADKAVEKARAALFAIKPKDAAEKSSLRKLQAAFTFWFVAPNTLKEAHERWNEWKKLDGEAPIAAWDDAVRAAGGQIRERDRKYYGNIKKWTDEYTGRREKAVGYSTVSYESALLQYLGGAQPHEGVDPTVEEYHEFDDEEHYESDVLYEAHFVFWLMRVILKDLISDKCVGADRLEKAHEIRDAVGYFDGVNYAGFVERLFIVADSVNACGAGQTSLLFGLRGLSRSKKPTAE